MNDLYDKERAALNLLHPDFDEKPAHHQQALHHGLIRTTQALIDAGVVKRIEDDHQ